MHDSTDFMGQAYWEYREALLEYCNLAVTPELSEAEADRLSDILAQAESNEILSFFLNEIDYIVGQMLCLGNDSHFKGYKDQQAWLREHLELLQPEDLDFRRDLQRLLKKEGYYKGPVDGVFGKESLVAVEEFQRSSSLEVDGIIGTRTLQKLFARLELSESPAGVNDDASPSQSETTI